MDLLSFVLAVIGALTVFLFAIDAISFRDGMVPVEKFRALEEAQRVHDIARAAERAMFEETLRSSTATDHAEGF